MNDSYRDLYRKVVQNDYCIGCGVCAAVCPRGVLKLENLAEEGRFEAYLRPEEQNY